MELVDTPRTEVVALDFDRDHCMPIRNAFGTSELLLHTPFHNDSEASAKRNTAIALSHLTGWDRVFFLDDDVAIDDPDHIRSAAGLLDKYAVTGLTVHTFPDLSVAAHAYRRLGGQAKPFLAGGVLMTAPRRRKSFFPEIYNDDAFYLLDEHSFPPLALTGLATQDEYDPFDDPARAIQQEFGEVVAIGLHHRTRDGAKPHEADRDFWRDYLPIRRRFLDYLSTEYHARMDNDPDSAKIIAAIQAAEDTLSLITPAFCTAYVDAWLRDRTAWIRYLDSVADKRMTTVDAVAELGLPALVLS
ncbi:hypothetical protein ACQPZ2_24550 [Nocardia pseudovaccinii]|uniref:hypothetical protein n=1 Tax=Nocardia pseudovaccinii TaxID=189540 RepID=UPI003D92291F